MTKNIDSIISEAEADGARVGYHAIMPDGTQVGYREHELFKSASTIKTPIMIELFRQVDAGQRTLQDIHVLREEDFAPSGGVMHELHPGLEFTLRDVLYLMMSISDNTATNILIRMVGMDNVNQAMRSIGMERSQLGRLMKGVPAEGDEQENLATPAEFTRVYQAILDGTAASAESCMAMMQMLQLQANQRRIGRFVPEGTVWGSKTGSVGTLTADSGFVMTADGPLIVAVYVDDAFDTVAGEIIISEIVRELIMWSL